MIKNKSIYKSIYTSGKEAGFDVISARQYYENNDVSKPRLEVRMNTPYFDSKGHPMTAYAVVNIESTSVKDNKLRDFNTVEFYDVDGHNMDYDVSSNLTDNMCEQAGKFASAASEYPHVFTYDEYVVARIPINKRMQIDPPSESDYGTYLENVERQMNSRKVEYIGSITKSNQLHEAYKTMPSFDQMMDEVSASVDDEFDL